MLERKVTPSTRKWEEILREKKDGGENNKKKGTAKAPSSQNRRKDCFLSNDPHMAREYLKREKLNALSAEEDGDVEHDPMESTSLMNPFQFLNIITTEKQTCFKQSNVRDGFGE